LFFTTYGLTLIIINMMIPISWLLTRTPIRHVLPFNALHATRSLGKQMYAFFFMFMNQVIAPIPMHITTEGMSLEELFEDGPTAERGDMKLPDRLIFIGNHQVSRRITIQRKL
jgi:hypothetical protein